MTLWLSILAIVLGGLYVLGRRQKQGEPAFCMVCEKELKNPVYENGYAFCAEHAFLYKSASWPVLMKGRSTPEDPEFGVRLWKLKQELSSKGLRSYIESSYSSEESGIVTKMELRVLEEDLEGAKALSRSKISD